MTLVKLELHTVLHQPGERLKTAYFVEKGVISILAVLLDGDAVEVGMIGSEGFLGVEAWLGIESTPHRAVVQVPGEAWSMPTKNLRAMLSADSAMSSLADCFAQSQWVMAAQAAACNGLHEASSRLAKWLLTAADRADTHDFPITQEYMAQMLGVRRATVNLTISTLVHAGLVEHRRGHIRITDRKGLESAACECYTSVRQEYHRLGLG